MHIVQVVTCPSNLKNGQSNIILVGYHAQPNFTSNIVHYEYTQQLHFSLHRVHERSMHILQYIYIYIYIQ